ncbi:SDR family NAD(P)-dependent oxidoreductase [Algibacter mikhailovii]|uniref:SDR family NAD(P)-dependent oxidoreductase n=1 Tax=Algibacter mikhailovii TaxID=425498 RepID=UPI002495A231|nr:SDR family NAD(P)-dependent oxidoreductase [Algibacter mikhailovii]
MNKTILITGSTDGIGKLTALKLAQDGHTIFIHGRNASKVNAVVTEIKNKSKNSNIIGLVADFSNLETVLKMANEVKEKCSKLDILINNAGVFKSTENLGYHGFDIRFVVNYLAPFILTKALIPVLQKGYNTRIINLSSAAQTSVSDATLAGNSIHDASTCYAQSKLAITMWSFYLAKQEPTITVIAVNPGSLLNTKMANEAYGQHWSPAEKGVNILYDLASQKEHGSDSGKYFDNDRGVFAKAHPDAYNKDKIEALITITNNIYDGVVNA